MNAVQSVVVVSQSGALRMALLHNTPAAFHGGPQLSEQLTGELTALVQSGRIVDREWSWQTKLSAKPRQEPAHGPGVMYCSEPGVRMDI